MNISDTTDLLALAERCEAATGADIDLDLAISEATKAWKTQSSWTQFRPTASIDAALTLVPDGYVRRKFGTDDDRRAFAYVTYRNGQGDPVWSGSGDSEALAICAAALRARSDLSRNSPSGSEVVE